MVNLMLKLQSFMLKVFIIKKLNKKKSCIIDGTFVGKIVSIYYPNIFFSNLPFNFLYSN